MKKVFINIALVNISTATETRDVAFVLVQRDSYCYLTSLYQQCRLYDIR
jgi:hypothetical protein